MRVEGPQSYVAHEELVADARRYPQIWRLVVGVLVVGVFTILANFALFSVVANQGPPTWVDGFLNGLFPVAVLVILASFVFVIMGVALAARLLQRRALRSIIGPSSRAMRQFVKVLVALLTLQVILLLLPPYGFGAPLVPNLAFGQWVLLLPLGLVAILIQTSAEEILFRGYLQQSLAARFRSPWIWMLVPSVLFGFGHYTPSVAGGNAMIVAVWAMIFGLITADLTARAGTLGPAIALHFFNNCWVILGTSMPDMLSGLALYHWPFDSADTARLRPWLYVDFAIMIVSWLTVRLAIRR
ncbi:CPBP family intramembrane glutamic endopeptidase [Ruegeria sp. HKCCC1038]|uniref:CPBP family intramembrane glutamic endopeptidase n=1 Tax=Ruegeria sp. HKCCC1038 TaxID=2682982 RepID=UPI001488647E|nr:type II CAAX endopeptidase family protein [Ruegeria sp. HKCCC1038]